MCSRRLVVASPRRDLRRFVLKPNRCHAIPISPPSHPFPPLRHTGWENLPNSLPLSRDLIRLIRYLRAQQPENIMLFISLCLFVFICG
jgi:hypothetical protein